jgi:hypothetical protein
MVAAADQDANLLLYALHIADGHEFIRLDRSRLQLYTSPPAKYVARLAKIFHLPTVLCEVPRHQTYRSVRDIWLLKTL